MSSVTKLVPLSLQRPSKTYKSIRYNGFIELPPSEQPFQDFLLAIKEYLKIIQDVLGKDVFITAWDSEQEKAFPPIKRPDKIPSTRESLGNLPRDLCKPQTRRQHGLSKPAPDYLQTKSSPNGSFWS
jgi:hypothetical protein